MAVHLDSLFCFSKLSRSRPFFLPFTNLASHTPETLSFFYPNKVKLPKNRLSVSAVMSEGKPLESSFSSKDWFKLTYLEGNAWLWDVNGLKILVDPILVGNLDFGIPWLYDAAKKFVKNFQLSDLPELDCLLITQSLDDHCHLNTLKPLSKMLPNLPVIATPNAETLLNPLFST
ncbi:hypothetical protein MKW94_026859, partial [Papaver nudicaule]|nr:hypothetical protein [Papaver nudicaule]